MPCSRSRPQLTYNIVNDLMTVRGEPRGAANTLQQMCVCGGGAAPCGTGRSQRASPFLVWAMPCRARNPCSLSSHAVPPRRAVEALYLPTNSCAIHFANFVNVWNTTKDSIDTWHFPFNGSACADGVCWNATQRRRW